MRLKDLAADEVRKEPRVVLFGMREVLIERHRGIKSFDPACVRVRAGGREICVTGRGLSIPYFGLEDMVVAGDIQSLYFEGEKV